MLDESLKSGTPPHVPARNEVVRDTLTQSMPGSELVVGLEIERGGRRLVLRRGDRPVTALVGESDEVGRRPRYLRSRFRDPGTVLGLNKYLPIFNTK